MKVRQFKLFSQAGESDSRDPEKDIISEINKWIISNDATPINITINNSNYILLYEADQPEPPRHCK